MGEPLSLANDRNLALEARIKQHLRDTSTPETCSGLDWSRPDKGKDYENVSRVILELEKRPDRAPAPCPICSPRAPKWLWGYLAWFPFEGVYRCIGHECAKRAIGLAQAEGAERRFRDREAHNADYEFAFDNISRVPGMLAYFAALEPLVVHAERLIGAMGRAHLRRIAYQAAKAQNGRLILWEPATGDETGEQPARPDLSPPDGAKFIPVEMGMLAGYECLGPNRNITRDLRVHASNLRAFEYHNTADAEAWVLDNFHRRNDLAAFRKTLAKSRDVQRKTMGYLTMVQSFFSAQNFELLRRFGADHRNPTPFYAAHRNGEYLAGLTRAEATKVRPDFGALDQLPPWHEP